MITVLNKLSKHVDEFRTLYENDKMLARIYASQIDVTERTITLNEKSKDEFQIFYDIKKYGVSKTMRIYARSKSEKKIFVNKTKFFTQGFRGASSIMPATAMSIKDSDLIIDLFNKRFSWTRFLIEWQLDDISFNSIVRYKLYSRDKVLRHIYKCPPKVALKIREQRITARDWIKILKSSTNAENLNIELMEDGNFITLRDAAFIAEILCEKINLSWSIKRLTNEHDRLSILHAKYLSKLDDRPLNISTLFLELAEFIGHDGVLLRTSGELIAEGAIQHHCVGGYASSVDLGYCAVFNIKGYTCEFGRNSDGFIIIRQLRGKRNCNPPDHITRLVESITETFNSKKKLLGPLDNIVDPFHQDALNRILDRDDIHDGAYALF